MGLAIGRNHSVHTEIAVIRDFPEIAAVGKFRSPDGSDIDRMVTEFPHTAAKEAVIGINAVPVSRQASGAVSHCMAVFAEPKWIFQIGIFQKALLNQFRAEVHPRVNIHIPAEHLP